MALVEKSVLIEYSAAQMYALVENVAAYPEFLPWCGGTEILKKEGDITRASHHHRFPRYQTALLDAKTGPIRRT